MRRRRDAAARAFTRRWVRWFRYTRKDVVFDNYATEPHVVRGPRGEFVMYFTGNCKVRADSHNVSRSKRRAALDPCTGGAQL